MPDYSHMSQSPERQRGIPFPAIALLFVVLCVVAFLHSPYFEIRQVRVSGADYLLEHEILLIADIPEKSNVFLVPTKEIERRLVATPRIREARVDRIIPDTLRIHLEERATVTYLPYGGYFIDIDEHGCAVAVSEAITDPDVPLLLGVIPTYVAVGERVKPERSVAIGAAIGAALVRQKIPNLSEVDVTSLEDVVIRTSDGIRVLVGCLDGIEERVRLLDSILASVREQGTPVDYVDVRVEAKPVIRVKR
ncbi:MAG: cell division protein FtsQ/DivIB [Bacillota bacterium]